MIYVALLRGVNVAGRTVPSKMLRELFGGAGFTGVKTILASGNVRFESADTDADTVKTAVEAALRQSLGFDVTVHLRTLEDIKAVIAADPFRVVTVTPDIRRYVSFYSAAPKGALPVPYTSDNGDIRVLVRTDGEVYGVVTLTPRTGTTDYMALLDREYGSTVTTRNWNTLLKLAAD